MADPTDPAIPQLRVQRLEQGGSTVIALEGELDLATVGELEAALEGTATRGARVCLDLAALGFIDSTGLAAVIRAHAAVTEVGGRIVVVCVEGAVRRTFETTGLNAMLVLASSRASALRDIAA